MTAESGLGDRPVNYPQILQEALKKSILALPTDKSIIKILFTRKGSKRGFRLYVFYFFSARSIIV
ncbi:hypothetical protein LR69_02894 [Geobacillus sp. BCO2]|nr:hypothetical protein LR69_02894 [Geobacillus sp. BCO2]